MKTEGEYIEATEDTWEDIKEYWSMLLDRVDDDDPQGAEHLLLKRDNFNKLPGEDELYGWLMFEWLKQRLEEKLGRKPLVELNDKAVIVPIETEKES